MNQVETQYFNLKDKISVVTGAALGLGLQRLNFWQK